MPDELIAAEQQPVIPAARVTLRPLRPSDAGLLRMYAGDRRVAEWTRSIPHPLPPGMIEAFIARTLAPGRVEDVWAIDGTETGLGELVGVIGLKRMEDGPPRQSEIGYWVAPALWNTGLASEAVQALLAANPQGLRTVFAEVFQGNDGSARVLTNAGFDYIGDAEAWCLARGGAVQTWNYLKRLP